MILYLACVNKVDFITEDCYRKLSGLISYESMDKKGREIIPKLRHFILDSGAFTYMMNTKKKADVTFKQWEEYVDKYADFINNFNVQLFFELDIDVLIGYEKVVELRKRLIEKTGKMPIPVWHISRGKQNYLDMCDEFPYVAFGGMLSDGFSSKQLMTVLPWFIEQAHKRQAKIHGLGFTYIPALKKLHFDSVDSSSWVQSAIYGNLSHFTGDNLKVLSHDKKLERGATWLNNKQLKEHNFEEWFKFSRYAESHL